MRPTYQTQKDLENEAEVIGQLAEHYKSESTKLKDYFPLDYAFVRDKRIVSLAEVKCRNYSSSQIDSFGGLIISAHKMLYAKQYHDAFLLPFVLALRLIDGIFVFVVKAVDPFPKFPLVVGGRTDRNDPQDIEPCCLISMDHFKKLGDTNA